jgi:ribosome recycling factor
MKPESATANHNFQNVKEIEAHARTRMDKVLTDLQHEMASIRTGRASVSIFDGIKVDYYGTPTPLNQVANLHAPEPSLITIQPWDVSQIGAIEKAIRGSDLGLNPANDRRAPRGFPKHTPRRQRALEETAEGQAYQRGRRAPGSR